MKPYAKDTHGPFGRQAVCKTATLFAGPDGTATVTSADVDGGTNRTDYDGDAVTLSIMVGAHPPLLRAPKYSEFIIFRCYEQPVRFDSSFTFRCYSFGCWRKQMLKKIQWAIYIFYLL